MNAIWGAGLSVQDALRLGWEEWLALPELGLSAIKAKIDTGARTSALHAFSIEEIGTPAHPRVRFSVHPIPGRTDVAIDCMADVIDKREITSSNGEIERRIIVRTLVDIGGRQWPIEVSLTNREAMSYRMLLGRQAVREDVIVDPTASFVQPRLSYRVYGAAMRIEPLGPPLGIAILSRRPENAGNRRLIRQAELRGHTIPVIDRRRISLFIATRDPAILVNGKPLEVPDAVIFRAGRSPSPFSLAIVRQMEALGTYAVNPADVLARVGDPLVLRQSLARAGLPVPEIAVNPSDTQRKPGSATEHALADSIGAVGSGPLLRFCVVSNRALCMIERGPATSLNPSPDWQAAELDRTTTAPARAVAEKAVEKLGLGLACVDVALTRTGPVIVDLTANVSISQFERLTGAAIAEAVILHIERVVAARQRKSAPSPPA